MLASTGTQTCYHKWGRVVLMYSIFSLACAALQLLYRKMPLLEVSTHFHLHSHALALVSQSLYASNTRALATRSHSTVDLRLSITVVSFFKKGCTILKEAIHGFAWQWIHHWISCAAPQSVLNLHSCLSRTTSTQLSHQTSTRFELIQKSVCPFVPQKDLFPWSTVFTTVAPL